MRVVLVTGSRDWTDGVAILTAIVDELDRANVGRVGFLVIHGDCPTGADALAEHICERQGIHSARVKARWGHFGRGAGPIRNGIMVDMEPDVVLAFHPHIGDSKGTRDCVNRALAKGIRVRLFDGSSTEKEPTTPAGLRKLTDPTTEPPSGDTPVNIGVNSEE